MAVCVTCLELRVPAVRVLLQLPGQDSLLLQESQVLLLLLQPLQVFDHTLVETLQHKRDQRPGFRKSWFWTIWGSFSI